MSKLLIGFSGSSGSGKTTLVNELGKKLRGRGYTVAVVVEVVRKVFSEIRQWKDVNGLLDVRHNSSFFIHFQKRILEEQAKAEQDALKKADVVLTDRTIYDNYFYTIFWYNYSQPTQYKDLEEYVRKFRDIEVSKPPYDIIFYCELLTDNVDDGFRTPDLTYRLVQHDMIRRLIQAKRVVELPNVSLGKRVKMCLDVIEEVIHLEV